LEETLQKPLTEAGYDAPALVQQYLADHFDADYSQPSCRRLMKEAGLSYQKPRRQTAEAEAEDRKEFRDDLKKSGGRWTPQ
jgi:transposase